MTYSLQPLFRDRSDAGLVLAQSLEDERHPDTVVVGLARGGVLVAAEIARELQAPLDAVAVRKVRNPWQPEYAIGAVTPLDGVFLRSRNGLSDDQVALAVPAAQRGADELDRRLHALAPGARGAASPARRRRPRDRRDDGRRRSLGAQPRGGSRRGCRSGGIDRGRRSPATRGRPGRLPLRVDAIRRGRQVVPRFPRGRRRGGRASPRRLCVVRADVDRCESRCRPRRRLSGSLRDKGGATVELFHRCAENPILAADDFRTP